MQDMNELAFPLVLDLGQRTEWYTGMTLRDYFAAKVLQGLIADPSWQGLTFSTTAATAYEVADAMLEARKK